MQPPPCPEVIDVPRVRLFWIALVEPGAMARVIRQSIPLWASALLDHFGQVEGKRFGRIDRSFPWAFWSFGDAMTALPTWLFTLCLGLSVAGGAVALFRLVAADADAPSEVRRLLPSVVLVLAVIQMYSFAAALIGDGFVDLPRHSILGQLCGPPLFLGALLLFLREERAASSSLRQRRPEVALSRAES
jgi:hypothetical protein